MLEFEPTKLFKVVYEDKGDAKSPTGYIIDYDHVYILMRFEDGKTKYIPHSQIITINEI